MQEVDTRSKPAPLLNPHLGKRLLEKASDVLWNSLSGALTIAPLYRCFDSRRVKRKYSI